MIGYRGGGGGGGGCQKHQFSVHRPASRQILFLFFFRFLLLSSSHSRPDTIGRRTKTAFVGVCVNVLRAPAAGGQALIPPFKNVDPLRKEESSFWFSLRPFLVCNFRPLGPFKEKKGKGYHRATLVVNLGRLAVQMFDI